MTFRVSSISSSLDLAGAEAAYSWIKEEDGADGETGEKAVTVERKRQHVETIDRSFMVWLQYSLPDDNTVVGNATVARETTECVLPIMIFQTYAQKSINVA